MRVHKALILVGAAMAAWPTCAVAQGYGTTRRPVLVGAVSAGALGYTASSASASSLLGGYSYVAFNRMMIGAQGGSTLHTHGAQYVFATLGYPARVERRSQVYPFFGVGGGSMPSTRADSHGLMLGAGVGLERVAGRNWTGSLLGVRGGYVYRSGDGYERGVYVAVSVGASRELGREPPRPRRPVVIASR